MAFKLNLLIFISFILLYIIFILLKNKDYTDTKKESLNLSLFVSILIILSSTIFPKRFDVGFREFEIANLVHFRMLTHMYLYSPLEFFLYQTIGNFILFIPLGFFSYYKFGNCIIKAILLSLVMTLSVEFIQGFIPTRSCDIDDVLINTLGGMFGSFTAYIFNLFFNFILKFAKNSD